ncbi:MAG: ATP-dependent zinc metalloprotease FtsH [Zavarzinella sp.]
MKPEPAKPGKDPQRPERASPLITMTFISGALLLVAFFVFLIFKSGPRNIDLQQFDQLVNAGAIKELVVASDVKLTGVVRDNSIEFIKEMKLPNGAFAVVLPKMEDQNIYIRKIASTDAEVNEKSIKNGNLKPIKITVDEDLGQLLSSIIYLIFPIVLLAIFFLFILPRMRDPMGGGFASSFTRSSARRMDKTSNRTTFRDVAGMDNSKKELEEVVEFLREPAKFVRLGAEVPKGVLLVGPPGTGKTLLARAVAGEAGVPFFSINGSEFIQMFVGVGASRVRDLFRTAKENAPCLIFIDEIDAVGRMRGAGVGGGSDEREQTLNQILGEMDGFTQTESIIVVAATNRPDVLDAALLRPGRFDRHVTVDRPTWQGRLDILKLHIRNKPIHFDVNLEKIARNAMGMSGAELKNLANEAAIFAARESSEAIKAVHFDRAAERILFGAKRDHKHNPEEQKRTAYHEAGHALCGWYEPHADPLWKVSILPRGQAAGVTVSQIDEDKIDQSRTELISRLVVIMGGRAADNLVYGEERSGAMNDLKQATRIARIMVTQLGMSSRLGPVYYRSGEEHVFLGKEIHESRDFSDVTAHEIDQETKDILREAEDRAINLLQAHRKELELLTEKLLEKEELDRDEVEQLIGPRPPKV